MSPGAKQSADTDYVPALRFRALTPLYDAVVRVTTREKTFKEALIRQAEFAPGQRVLDLATGTGTLAIWIKQREPRLDRAPAYALPYPDAHFDRVVSSLFFHHLRWEDKRRTAREILRVLKPGGELHVADWGRAANALMRGLFLMIQALDGFESTRDNVDGKLIALFNQAGFAHVAERRTFATVFGTLALYNAVKPDDL